MNHLLLFLYALSVRFFLFEMNLFSTVRRWGREWVPGASKLFDCAFCSGFWVGLIVFGGVEGWSYYLVPNALVVGYLAFFLRLKMEYMAEQIDPASGMTPDGD